MKYSIFLFLTFFISISAMKREGDEISYPSVSKKLLSAKTYLDYLPRELVRELGNYTDYKALYTWACAAAQHRTQQDPSSWHTQLADQQKDLSVAQNTVLWTKDNTVNLLDTLTDQTVTISFYHQVKSAQLNDNATKIVIALENNVIHIVDISTTNTLAQTEIPSNKSIQSVHFIRNSENIYVHSFDEEKGNGCVEIYDQSLQYILQQGSPIENGVASYSVAARTIASAASYWDRPFHIWPDNLEHTLASHSFYFSPYKLLLDASATWLLMCAYNGTIDLYNLKDGTKPYVKSSHAGMVKPTAFNKRGNECITVSDDCKIALHTINKPSVETKEFNGHFNRVISAIFSPDENLIISTAYDNTVRMWDKETQNLIHRYTYQKPQKLIALNKMQDKLISLSYDGILSCQKLYHKDDLGCSQVLQNCILSDAYTAYQNESSLNLSSQETYAAYEALPNYLKTAINNAVPVNDCYHIR